MIFLIHIYTEFTDLVKNYKKYPIFLDLERVDNSDYQQLLLISELRTNSQLNKFEIKFIKKR